MKKSQKTETETFIPFQTLSTSNLGNLSLKQEELNIFSKSKDYIKEGLISVSPGKIKDQLNEIIPPLLNAIKTNSNEDFLGLEKITIELGIGLEGNVFIAKGTVNASIRLEFNI